MFRSKSMNEIPKIFVISPKELTSRREAIKAHLEALWLDPILFSGIYGNDVGLMSSRAKNDSLYSTLSPNGMALGLNHWFLWNHIVLANIPTAIILEDDVLLSDNFKEIFAENMVNIPDNWDIVYLSNLFPDRIDDGRIMAEKIKGNIWHHKGAKTWDGGIDGTHAYMVSLEGAKKMINIPFTLDEPIDRWMSFNILPKINVYIWHPSLIKPRSSIGEWKTTR